MPLVQQTRKMKVDNLKIIYCMRLCLLLYCSIIRASMEVFDEIDALHYLHLFKPLL